MGKQEKGQHRFSDLTFVGVQRLLEMNLKRTKKYTSNRKAHESHFSKGKREEEGDTFTCRGEREKSEEEAGRKGRFVDAGVLKRKGIKIDF